MSIWNTTGVAVSASLNVVTTAATTIDRTVASVDNASRYLEQRSRLWADAGIAECTAAHQDAINDRRLARIERNVDEQARLAKRMTNPEFAKLWEAEANRLKSLPVS